MSLRPTPPEAVPAATVAVAHAAVRRGNPYLRLRDALGSVFAGQQFASLFPSPLFPSPLFPSHGQPAEAPWRLALVTLLQFAENLSDRQAADAARGRIDWKHLLGLELTDPGFDASALCVPATAWAATSRPRPRRSWTATPSPPCTLRSPPRICCQLRTWRMPPTSTPAS